MVKIIEDVGTVGFGLMGLTWRPNPAPEEQAFAAMKAAYDNGAIFWNGGEFYGTKDYNSMHLLAKYFTKYPEHARNVVLSIKGGFNEQMKPDGTPEGIRRSVDNVIRTLGGKKTLDIFECARVDPNTPIETTIEALAEYIRDGKLKGISLSEVRAETIRRAHKVHPISCVEVEFSLWSTDILENDIAATCGELGIPIVAYSPLGRGFLTGEVKSLDDIPADDFRRHFPRFQPEVFEKNLQMVEELEKLAKKNGCSPAQLALAWIKQLSGKPGMPEIIPIPGATTVKRVEENVQVITLKQPELEEIDKILKSMVVFGDRYGGPVAELSNG
ncbi:Pyridoxine 4-dehydrogenase [Sticta canariensis]|nr:Pyridoxine 4-dehydrogenase [Sticta canariensis]